MTLSVSGAWKIKSNIKNVMSAEHLLGFMFPDYMLGRLALIERLDMFAKVEKSGLPPLKLITVYKVEYCGRSYYDTNLDAVMVMIEDSDYDEDGGYTITKVLMDEWKYNSLDEFTGF